jgi:hypothetical protein
MMTGEEVNAYDAFLVFLNGLIVGVHTKPTQLVEKGMLSMRFNTSPGTGSHLMKVLVVLTALIGPHELLQCVSCGEVGGLESSCRCI